MPEQVKLPREVAEALDRELEKEDDYFQIVADVNSRNGDDAMIMSDWVDSPDKALRIMQALANGYEVEETPEDRVQDFITRLINVRNHEYTLPEDVERINAEIFGAKKVIDLLNIKIKGVND